MKPAKKYAYFPVLEKEQAILERIRNPDLSGRLDEIPAMLDLLADAKLSSADLVKAIDLLEHSRQGADLESRFKDLEQGIDQRLEKGLAEIEGRLARLIGRETAFNPLKSGETVPLTGPSPALQPQPSPPGTPTDVGHAHNVAKLAFRIGGEVVSGPNASKCYISVWRWLFEHGHVKITDLPIGTPGKKRYLVAVSPVHPTGKEFRRAEQPVPGAFLECNLSRPDIVRYSKKYLDYYGVTYEVLLDSEG
jgi:hypothetical protein